MTPATYLGLTLDEWLGILRTALGSIGGVLIGAGVMTDTSWAIVSSIAPILASAVWSVYQKRHAAATLATANITIAKVQIQAGLPITAPITKPADAPIIVAPAGAPSPPFRS